MSIPNQTFPCPNCRTITDHLMPIDPPMRNALKDAGQPELPASVCSACFEKLSESVSQGLKLRMGRDLREKSKMIAWKNRVHLIKNARGLMSQKSYAEAAVQYEKYLRVLEVVYNLKKGDLSPAVFNNSIRSKEMTVVASVYWDLLRIYDTNPRYADRMSQVAGKLAQFLPFSQIFPDIIQKAESFAKTAKNPGVVHAFLRQSKKRRGACFVATAAFADEPHALELVILRTYRDQALRPHYLGRQAIYLYYRLSPPLARALGNSPAPRRLVRWLITKIAKQMKKSLNSSATLDDLNL